MKWNFRTVTWDYYVGSERRERTVPSVYSDDGTVFMWCTTIRVEEYRVITVVYQKNDIEAKFDMTAEMIGSDVAFSLLVTNPNSYYRKKYTDRNNFIKEKYNPSECEINSIKNDLLEVIPLTFKSPYNPISNILGIVPDKILKISL